MISSGVQFPNNILTGHLHFKTDEGLYYRYLGGVPTNSLNWVVFGGAINGDPDTTGWTVRQDGAWWFNKTENVIKYWDGSTIVILGSQINGYESFVFAPDKTDGGGIYTTWATLYAAYSASSAVVRDIFFGGDVTLNTYTIPAGSYVFDSNTRWIGAVRGTNAAVDISDGVSISGLSNFLNMTLQGNALTSPAIDISNLVVFLDEVSIISTGVPVFFTGSGLPTVFLFDSISVGLGSFVINGANQLELIRVGSNIIFSDDSIRGSNVGATFLMTDFIGTGQSIGTQANFVGTITNTISAFYVGTTANRPIGVPTGYQYFDTTLGIPIFRSGANWINASGGVV